MPKPSLPSPMPVTAAAESLPVVAGPPVGAPRRATRKDSAQAVAAQVDVQVAPVRIVARTAAPPKAVPVKVRYDCSKCPGYCCSYDRIEVKPRDVARLARHFGLTPEQAERRFTRLWAPGERILRHQSDDVYKSICRFFDRTERRCTIYAARPAVCREYPNGNKCGYYDFLMFERGHQDDETFIPSA